MQNLLSRLRQPCGACLPAPTQPPDPRGRSLSPAQASRDAADAAQSMLNSLTSVDEDEMSRGGFTADPTDPNKFFQNSPDTFRQDAILFCAVVGLLYVLVQAWTLLETGKL